MQPTFKKYIDIERCSKFGPRLSILPLYPTSDLHQNEQYPLLTNVSCKYLDATRKRRHRNVQETTKHFVYAFSS